MAPATFKVITFDDWKRALRDARARRSGAVERMRSALVAKKGTK